MRNFQFSSFPKLTPAVANILFANIFIFIITYIGERNNFDLAKILGFFYPSSPNFHSWQIITYMFMHGGFEHILFNMFALYTFGNILENIWGTERFVYFYFITGVGAIILQMGVQAFEVHQITGSFSSVDNIPDALSLGASQKLYAINEFPTVGASGAIFGLLLAFGILFPNTELYLFFIPIPIKAKYFVSGYILLELWQGFKQNPGDNVAHFAHLGGALFGFLLIKYWDRKNSKRFY